VTGHWDSHVGMLQGGDRAGQDPTEEGMEVRGCWGFNVVHVT